MSHPVSSSPFPSSPLPVAPQTSSHTSSAAQNGLKAETPELSPRSLKASLLKDAHAAALHEEDLQRISALVLIATMKDEEAAVNILDEATDIANKMADNEEAFVKIAGAWACIGKLEKARNLALEADGLLQALVILEALIFTTNADPVTLNGLLECMATRTNETDSRYVQKRAQALLKIARIQKAHPAKETIDQIKEEARNTPAQYSYFVVETLAEVAKLEAMLGDITTAKETLQEAERNNTTSQDYGSALIAKARAKVDLAAAKAFPREAPFACDVLIACAREDVAKSDFAAARDTLTQAIESLPVSTPRNMFSPVLSYVAIAELEVCLGNVKEAKAMLRQATMSMPRTDTSQTVEILVEIMKVEKTIDPKAAKETLQNAIIMAKSSARSLAMVAEVIDKTVAIGR